MIDRAQGIAHAPGYALATNRQPTRAVVKYMGDVRAIASEKRGFMELYSRTIFRRTLGDDYVRELRFLEGEREYWIPVQEAQLPALIQEVQAGDVLTLFTLLLGAQVKNDRTEWFLSSSEFESQDVTKHWFKQLCGTD